MRVIVVGLGVQGYKRRRFAGADFVAAVDPVNTEAAYRRVTDVPIESFDAALVCTPDQAKAELLRYLLECGKHVLVEKPLWAERDEDLVALGRLARERSVVCYTAYNHRFEPHYVAMRRLLAEGSLGRIYRCRMFYGNGTARLVRDSAWRDQGAGVLPDLGSHLLDTVDYWFGDVGEFRVVSASRFENRAPDHVVISAIDSEPQIELEMTLLSWRNHFTCDMLAEHGTAHIRSLCKWGPTTYTVRRRVLPSGRPSEESTVLVCDDPTWALEYAHFTTLCANRTATDLAHDLRLQQVLRRLGHATLAGKPS